MAEATLSDKGLSIFVFAAYHQLTTGEPVAEVVTRDSAGHKAHPQGLREVEEAGLAHVNGDRATFSDTGHAFLQTMLEAIRSTAGKA